MLLLAAFCLFVCGLSAVKEERGEKKQQQHLKLFMANRWHCEKERWESGKCVQQALEHCKRQASASLFGVKTVITYIFITCQQCRVCIYMKIAFCLCFRSWLPCIERVLFYDLSVYLSYVLWMVISNSASVWNSNESSKWLTGNIWQMP